MNKINRQSLLDLIAISHRLENYPEEHIRDVQAAALKDPKGAVEMFPVMFAVLDEHRIAYSEHDGKIFFPPVVSRLLKGA